MTPEEARRVVDLATPRRHVADLKHWHWRNMACRAVTIDELRGLCNPTVRALRLFHHLVPAKNIVDITAWPQSTFRIRRLVIPDAIAGDFVIHDLKIANRSEFRPEITELSGDVFAVSAPGIDLNVGPVGPALAGGKLVLSVEYVGNEADGAVFQGTYLGTLDGGAMIALPINSLDPIRPSVPETVTIDLDEDRYHFVIKANQLTSLSRVPRMPSSSSFVSTLTTFEMVTTHGWEASAHSQRSFEPPFPIAIHVEHFPEVPYTVLYGIDEATDRVVLEVGEGMASNNRPFLARCSPEGYVPEWWKWRRSESA